MKTFKGEEISYSLLMKEDVVMEQLRKSDGIPEFFSWSKDDWLEGEIRHDQRRIAVWKVKGSNIQTMPDKK